MRRTAPRRMGAGPEIGPTDPTGAVAAVITVPSIGSRRSQHHFRNFREALTFAQEIGELADAEGHHPNISFGGGNAPVSLQTKKIRGLHENDFIMATKIDRIPVMWNCGPNRRRLNRRIGTPPRNWVWPPQ